MTGIVDWASERSRMVIAFIVLSLAVGTFAYVSLPKEGEPDIDIPALFVSVPFPGISAADAEKLLVKPMETELGDIDGLKSMSGTAAEGYAGLAMEFEFGWDKTKVLADVRDRMNTVEAQFPAGAEKYSVNEINFSEFPIIVVDLTGPVPERTLLRVAKDLQDRIEGMDAVLEASLTGHRDEMLEVIIDPLRLEAYNVTAGELIGVVTNNNQLIAAGEVDSSQGSFAVKIPSSFDEPQDVYNLPVKTNGDRVVTLGDLAEIRLTFEDRTGTARFDGEPTVALQVVKRKGFNLIDTANEVREMVELEASTWSPELQNSIKVGTSMDQSIIVDSMVRQLEGSVLTAIALVMIVVLAALGPRPALLVGFAIPTSFLLCFAFLAVMGITISNIVMFGLILAVGMLVDGAIVVVEYADKRISEGSGPMQAYVEAAKRMFWPIVSSTATTLCAFLPMLFWPGVPGEFMGMLPVTLIFVLSASLVVALVYLPVLGGVSGRVSRTLNNISQYMRARFPWIINVVIAAGAIFLTFLTAQGILASFATSAGVGAVIVAAIPFILSLMAVFVMVDAARIERAQKRIVAGTQRTSFGYFIQFIVGNPIMPVVSIGMVVVIVMTVFSVYGTYNRGVEFFVESEPEQAIVYVRARGNLSLAEKDEMVRQVEDIVMATPGIETVFAFAGDGGLNQNTGGASGPSDAVGQLQIELVKWENRKDQPELDGDVVIADLEDRLASLPGIKTEVFPLAGGPATGKPVHLRIKGDNWENLLEATTIARAHFDDTFGLLNIEDTRPLPGIDWQIDVDVEKAGRFGADVATVGAMVQLVTRGILLDTMRVDSSDEEIEIRVRLPEDDRILATLDTLKVRTSGGLVPLSNFTTRQPVAKLGQIDRIDQSRYFDVKADVDTDLQNEAGQFINPNERIAVLTEWLETEQPFANGIEWEWTGDQEDQAESQAFLSSAFAGALGLMFIILLAQFNSFYNSVLVLVAVVLSTTGVLIGMLIMGQPFSVIMTGTGIVALAGIVVNNNIVLIDTYQEYARYMPRIEAIVRTAEVRIRPVLLTTITTMAGLAPMMFGISLDFANGGYSIDSPTALWWKQLATAVVFGLGVATALTLVFTPAMLSLRVWATAYARVLSILLARMSMGRASIAARDWAIRREAKKKRAPEIVWDTYFQVPAIAPPSVDHEVADGSHEQPESIEAVAKSDETESTEDASQKDDDGGYTPFVDPKLNPTR